MNIRNTGLGLGAMLLGLAMAWPAQAQDINEGEIVVTASRAQQSYIDPRTNRVIEVDDDDAGALPAIGLRRRADNALIPVIIAGDTRDQTQRREEILTMVRSALELARRSNIELAIGDFFVVPLTPDNYRTLAFYGDGRPDSERVAFFIKTRLGTSADEANQAITRLEQFIRSVPAAGRAEIRANGPLTLSIVAPDQYRSQILDLIATDARSIAERFGPDQRVEAQGLDRPVQWRRAGVTEVFLYIPHRLVFRPAG
ncbi:TonB-dependent receptor [Sphingosinicella sp. YJ22]|uniref:TonB-dependent receptor n=1 Tax=Sphingosinicella sp. YJ22 TaxID=1104780 RepID=UPI001FAF0FCD|nr:TonB-dependent receptor [Sphingosinicella sp. YJ22]